MIDILNNLVFKKRDRKWKKFKKKKKIVKPLVENFFNLLNKIQFYSFLIETSNRKEPF